MNRYHERGRIRTEEELKEEVSFTTSCEMEKRLSKSAYYKQIEKTS